MASAFEGGLAVRLGSALGREFNEVGAELGCAPLIWQHRASRYLGEDFRMVGQPQVTGPAGISIATAWVEAFGLRTSKPIEPGTLEWEGLVDEVVQVRIIATSDQDTLDRSKEKPLRLRTSG